MRRGFTIVELLITLAVMAILLVLAVVSMRGVQLNARDSERKSDIATLGRALEVRYERGNPVYPTGGRGSYPSHDELWALLPLSYDNFQSINNAFPTASQDAFVDPSGIYSLGQVCNFDAGAGCLVPRSQSKIDQSVVNSGNGKPQYSYEPIKSDGGICQDDADVCTRYNLYWKSEVSGTVVKYKSQHQ